MTIWKSPVLYFGILLVVVVTSLMTAPLVINWNGYRGDLEAYGRQLTGREVRIDGGIAARLFPWPSLTMDDIHVANPPGMTDKEFASAERIVVRMTLGGLFNGNIEVESIDVEKPSFSFERLTSGANNWQLHPEADLMSSQVLDRVKLDRIALRGGTARYYDRRRGEAHQLEDLNAAISAPGIAGPWKLRAVGRYGAQAVDIGLNTGAWKSGEPFRFGFRLAAADKSGPVLAFDGSTEGGKVTGGLRVEPGAAGGGKGDAEGEFRPLVLTSKVAADFNEIGLDEIDISPADAADGGTLLSGSARLLLGTHVSASANLTAAMLDLDRLAGARARALSRDGGGLAVADGVLALLPRNVNLSGSLKITALKTGGETLDNVALSVDAASDAIRVKELSASLPGQARALFSGVFFPGKSGAELAGSLAIESGDARQLVSWAWPEIKDRVAAAWTGSRGRLKVQTDVSLTQTRLRFSKSEFELDGERGSGELNFAAGGRGSADIRLDMKRLDADSYFSGGAKLLGILPLSQLLAVIVPRAEAPDTRLTLQMGELLLNGVTASNVVLDVAAGSNGVDLRTLEIGSVGGARLEATGLILNNAGGPDGSIGIEATAEDPRGLLRLLGVAGDGDPAWVRSLGAATLKGTIAVRNDGKHSEFSLDASGTADGLTASLTGAVTGGPSLDVMEFKGSAQLGATSSGRLAALAGLTPVVADSLPAKLVVTLAGTPRDGFDTDLQLDTYGGHFDYGGKLKTGAAGVELYGKAGLRTTDAAQILAPLGLPLPAWSNRPLVIDASLLVKDGLATLPDIEGRFGADRFKADLNLDSSLKLTGNVETGPMVLADVLAVLFLDWTGAVAGLDTGFAQALPLGLTGEVWIKPRSLTVHEQFVARDVQIGITAKPDEIRLAMFGKDGASRDAHVEIGSKGTTGSRKIDGRISIPVDFGRQLQLADGGPVATGQGTVEASFVAEGRSPGGALASMRGNGSYAINGLELAGVTPEAFTRLIAGAKSEAGLAAALDGLRAGSGLIVGTAIGYVRIDSGVVIFQPVVLSTPDADVDIKVVGELALGAIDAAIGLKLKALGGLPPAGVAYAGPPMALIRSDDSAELATSLGVSLMRKGVDELERLKQEQQRLALLEEKQRQDDEARLAAYYAQRDEVLLRKRELKVHAEMRVVEAERLRRTLEAERAANAEINKAELKQRAREIRVLRRLARLDRASEADALPATPPRPRPAKPQTAPVINAPSQSLASPSQ